MDSITTAYRLDDAEKATYRRYARLALPRHTSYPTVPAWSTDYGPADFKSDLNRSADIRRPLSIYIHVPYCERLCYYCACTKEIVSAQKRQRQDPTEAFLRSMETEANILKSGIPGRSISQVHLGGGSPTFLRPRDLARLWTLLTSRFSIEENAEISIEVDPRTTTTDHLQTLHELGFNRISLGVQDLARPVQQAVNRIQPFEMIEQLVSQCHCFGFDSINFDLIYGLAFQTLETMAETLEKTIALAPDRIAFFRLAILPEIFRWQNTFHADDLPSDDLMLELYLLAINRFHEAGYELIGFDHFAKPDDALAKARSRGSLRRSFQGMSTGKDLEILGLGPSAISQLDAAYAQNCPAIAAWQQTLLTGPATERGIRLTKDDQLRAELLQQLYCYAQVDARTLQERFDIVFKDYFANELERLAVLVDEGLVSADDDHIRLSEPMGRLLVRVVAAVFDRYLPQDAFMEGLPTGRASRVG
jgi:oxygen-independent coproporphyrinogen-3 oxidase